ncbi:hypothetical protein [Haloarcula pelagica]|uniref:hypothetical protein n=1 Tax=Haloarcula pelagica TaxID=3033389 RepID=UPI0024C25FD9|nr:hypothetical protein [Halomicroarcula sp. YJ-61-S]
MLAGELRESVTLLVEEWRLLALGLAGPFVYGTWVVASGLVLEVGAPALKRAVATTVAGTPIRGLELFALLAWVVLPTLVAVAVVQRQLFNRHDNLANAYRMAEPGVLLVVPALALVGCLAALVTSGWSPLLVFALLAVTVHFLVRTVAFGHRVYTLSLGRTLLAMTTVSALSVVVGLLVRVPAVAGRDPRLASRVAAVGVADAVGAWTTLVGVEPTLLLRGTLFVPIVLSACYLLAQTTVAAVAKRRGLPTAPDRRPGQRVPESAQPSAAPSATRVAPDADPSEPTTADADPVADTDPTTTGTAETPDSGGDDHTGTGVFTQTDPVPPAGSDESAETTGQPDEPPVAAHSRSETATGATDRDASSGHPVVPTFEAANGDGTTDNGRSSAWADAETVIADTSEEAVDTGNDDTTEVETQKEIDCQSCGRRVSIGTDVWYCPDCGTALDTGTDR